MRYHIFEKNIKSIENHVADPRPLLQYFFPSRIQIPTLAKPSSVSSVVVNWFGDVTQSLLILDNPGY